MHLFVYLVVVFLKPPAGKLYWNCSSAVGVGVEFNAPLDTV